MKTLHLIRHAKSSWKDERLADIDRPLAPRGIRACAVMAPEIAKTGCDFSNVFISPAARVRETIERIAGNLKEISFTWTVAGKLYTFSAHDLLELCRNDLPTCAYARLELDADSWTDIGLRRMQLTVFLTPKRSR